MDNTLIDVSHWNGPIDWAKVKSSGVQGTFIKATNGAFNSDDQFITNSTLARKQGIKVGAYHFLLSTQDPDAQAENFLNSAKPGNLDLLPVVDVEWDVFKKRDRWLDVPAKARVAMVGRFIRNVRDALGYMPIVYTATSWWRPMIGTSTSYQGQGKPAVKFGDSPLWLASYTKKLSPLPAAWSNWHIWQYTATGKLPGISGNVDMNRLNVPFEMLLIPR